MKDSFNWFIWSKDLTLGCQNLNALSHPNATLAPQARQARASGEFFNYLLSRLFDILVKSLIWRICLLLQQVSDPCIQRSRIKISWCLAVVTDVYWDDTCYMASLSLIRDKFRLLDFLVQLWSLPPRTETWKLTTIGYQELIMFKMFTLIDILSLSVETVFLKMSSWIFTVLYLLWDYPKKQWQWQFRKYFNTTPSCERLEHFYWWERSHKLSTVNKSLFPPLMALRCLNWICALH